MSQHAWDPVFEPVVKEGENVKIIKDSKTLLGFFRVKWIEPLPQKIHNFGALAANTAGGNTEITDLYVNDLEFAQYRMILLDDIELTILQPAGKTRLATKSYAHIITPLTSQIAPHQTQIVVFEDETINFNPKNPTQYTRPIHRILYYGWRYILEKIWKPGDSAPQPTIPATTIQVEAA